MNENEFCERGLFIDSNGILYDENLNLYYDDDKDERLDVDDKRKVEIYNNQTEEVKQFLLEENYMNDDVSVCIECDKHTNDNTETKWDKDANPYCVECYK